jgi:hypothetical protein
VARGHIRMLALGLCLMVAKASRRTIALECNAAIFANTFAPSFGALAFTPPHAVALLRLRCAPMARRKRSSTPLRWSRLRGPRPNRVPVFEMPRGRGAFQQRQRPNGARARAMASALGECPERTQARRGSRALLVNKPSHSRASPAGKVRTCMFYGRKRPTCAGCQSPPADRQRSGEPRVQTQGFALRSRSLDWVQRQHPSSRP